MNFNWPSDATLTQEFADTMWLESCRDLYSLASCRRPRDSSKRSTNEDVKPGRLPYYQAQPRPKGNRLDWR